MGLDRESQRTSLQALNRENQGLLQEAAQIGTSRRRLTGRLLQQVGAAAQLYQVLLQQRSQTDATVQRLAAAAAADTIPGEEESAVSLEGAGRISIRRIPAADFSGGVAQQASVAEIPSVIAEASQQGDAIDLRMVRWDNSPLAAADALDALMGMEQVRSSDYVSVTLAGADSMQEVQVQD